MKNNCKNRKLKYIRTKNRLRLGIDSYRVYLKARDIHLESTKFINKLIEEAEQKLFKDFKLVLPFKGIATGYNNDDFIYDLITILIEFKKDSNLNLTQFKIV